MKLLSFCRCCFVEQEHQRAVWTFGYARLCVSTEASVKSVRRGLLCSVLMHTTQVLLMNAVCGHASHCRIFFNFGKNA